MKKVLFASTALVALSLTGVAQAADPIKLGLGGYSRWMIGYADNDDDRGDFQDVDIKGTNEIWFKGSTTLDNGIKIGVMVELEAGGHTDTTGGDTIDESYVTVDGAFGRLIIGTEDNGAYLIHVSAPSAAPLSEDSETGLNSGIWISRGTTIAAVNTTAIDTTGDSEKVTYVAPSFAGFTVGAAYVPNVGSEDNRTVQVNGISDVFGVAGAYNNTFGGFGLKASFGIAGAFDTDDQIDHHYEWSTGLQASYAGFTVGGGYRSINRDDNAGDPAVGVDGFAWTLGGMYAQGPFAVSFDYYASEARGGDSIDQYLFSGKYNIGPGVDLIGMIGYVDFNDAWADYNEGWVVATGLNLAF